MRPKVLAALLAIILVASVGAGYFAGVSNRATTTQTIIRITTTTERSLIGAESECGFASTCDVFNSAGLELSLSVDSTRLRPNGTVTVNVSEVNALPMANNITSLTHWSIDGLQWGCGYRYYFPNGIAVFSGYYSLNNITAGRALNIWPPIPCSAEFLFNGTNNIVGILQKVTSYSYLPESSYASYAAYYKPETGPITLGTFLPVHMFNEVTITATNFTYPTSPFVVALGSDAPGVYTLVAGDEWGDLVLLHLSVA